MGSLPLYLVGLAVIAGFAYLWRRTTPASGSGWALFAAVVIALFMNAPTNAVVGSIVYGALSLGMGAFWFASKELKYAGWLLATAILSAFSLMHFLLG